MGDRALIMVKSAFEDTPCGVYLHWDGYEVPRLLKEAVPFMREGDAEYSMARLVGYLHTQIEGNTGLGISHAPQNMEEETLREGSPGDAGVIVYDCDTGDVTYYKGYLEKDENAPKNVGIPPK